eukprot:COSAG05_NODE_324_length_11401_cov_6.009379_2_plen_101_part_00
MVPAFVGPAEHVHRKEDERHRGGQDKLEDGAAVDEHHHAHQAKLAVHVHHLPRLVAHLVAVRQHVPERYKRTPTPYQESRLRNHRIDRTLVEYTFVPGHR